MGSGLGGTAAGKADDLGPARGAGEEAVEGSDRIEGAVEIGADRGAPAAGIGLQGRPDLAMDSRAAYQSINVAPFVGDLGGGAGDLAPVRDVTTR